jgi:multiple sugar transport system permease protein
MAVNSGVQASQRSVDMQRRRRRATRRQATTVLRYLVVIFVCILILFPIYWMVLSTFQPESDSLTWPPPLFFKGFNAGAVSYLFGQQPVWNWLFHSFIVSSITVVITVALSIPGAYLLSHLRWRGVTAFGFLLLFTQMMPGAVVIIPELRFFRSMGWLNSLPALSLVYAAFSVPLGCWILKSSFDTIPGEIIDAALVDGCSALGVLGRILVPLSRPALVAVGVVAYFGAWNEYLFASAFITQKDLLTAALGLASLNQEGDIQLFELETAGLIISILPIILYLGVQRHVVRGLTAGAVK